MPNQKGALHLLLLLAGVGVLTLFLIFSFAPFGNKLFTSLFPKESSQAASALDWPQVQKDPQHTGYSNEQLNKNFAIKWKWNIDQTNPVRFAQHTQPVTSDGKLFIGAFDGKMYALDITTPTAGAIAPKVWEFDSGAPIMHSAAADSGKVVFASDNGKVLAVNETDGLKVWEYQAGAGFDNAPLVVNGTIYIGSKDSNLYAIDLTNGALKWKYQTSGPIYQTAAYSQSANAIIVGSEDMFVYALNLNGTLKWKSPKLNGQSFKHFWPVVSETKGVVIIRSVPSYGHTRQLNDGDSIIQQTQGASCPFTTVGTQLDKDNEQVALTNYLTSRPTAKTFFVLDLNTGQEKFVAPILHTGGSGSTPSAPAIDIDGNAVVFWRSCYSTYDDGSMVRKYADLGKLDLTTGKITAYEKNYSNRPFRLIADEETVLSIGGTNIYGTMAESTGFHNMSNANGTFIIKEYKNLGIFAPGSLYIFDDALVTSLYSTDKSGGHVAPPWSPAVISNGQIIFKSDGSALVGVSGTP